MTFCLINRIFFFKKVKQDFYKLLFYSELWILGVFIYSFKITM